MNDLSQHILSAEQVAEFYHDEFVRDQVTDFTALTKAVDRSGVVVDIGGGVGFFAERAHADLGCAVRVIEMDPESVARCLAKGVPAVLGDALAPPISGDEACICFNLILHHLVGQDEARTRGLQVGALKAWAQRGVPIFVNEYIYESFVSRISGRIIYEITSSRFLSTLAELASRVLPALRANTFGVGVRFRSHDEWRELFNEAGFVAETSRIGAEEKVRLPLRLLMIRTIRRDSYILRPAESMAH